MPQDLFPAEVPWNIVGQMSKKVIGQKFDLELAVMTTHVVGCCLTIAEKKNVTIPVIRPPMFSADAFSESDCSALAGELEALKASCYRKTGDGLAGPDDDLPDPEMSLLAIPGLLQLAFQLFMLISRNRKSS